MLAWFLAYDCFIGDIGNDVISHALTSLSLFLMRWRLPCPSSDFSIALGTNSMGNAFNTTAIFLTHRLPTPGADQVYYCLLHLLSTFPSLFPKRRCTGGAWRYRCSSSQSATGRIRPAPCSLDKELAGELVGAVAFYG